MRVAPSGRGRSLLYAGATAALLVSVLWLHARQGLSRPIPWPDEASLLWQAIAVQRETTLFAPQLRDYAHVLWMPPGYMWVTGLAFKLSGFSLEIARWLSALFVAGGGAALAAVFWRTRHPFAGLLLLAVFLWSPIAVLVGNVARMALAVGGIAGTGSASVSVSGANRQVDCVSGFDGLFVDFVPVWEPPQALSATLAVLVVAALARRGRAA